MVMLKADGTFKTKRCDCGRKVELFSAFENECGACGTLYNGYGQKLAPKSQWGYDTGESFGYDFDDE